MPSKRFNVVEASKLLSSLLDDDSSDSSEHCDNNDVSFMSETTVPSAMLHSESVGNSTVVNLQHISAAKSSDKMVVAKSTQEETEVTSFNHTGKPQEVTEVTSFNHTTYNENEIITYADLMCSTDSDAVINMDTSFSVLLQDIENSASFDTEITSIETTDESILKTAPDICELLRSAHRTLDGSLESSMSETDDGDEYHPSSNDCPEDSVCSDEYDHHSDQTANTERPDGGYIGDDSSVSNADVDDQYVPAVVSTNDHEGLTTCKVKARKRSRNPNDWEKNIRKSKKAKGEDYVDCRGRTVPAKKFTIKCSCGKGCLTNVDRDDQTRIFSSFLDIGNKNRQDIYLYGLIKKQKKITTRPRDGTRKREHSFAYSVKSPEGISYSVCHTAFCSIYGLTRKQLRRLQHHTGDTDIIDKRGNRGKKAKNATDDSVIVEMRQFIQSFPCRSSHYSCKKNPHRRYLHQSLSTRRMWIMFLDKHDRSGKNAVLGGKSYNGKYKLWLFRRIFNADFNLAFGAPRSDTCETCDRLNIQTSDTEGSSDSQARTEQHQHHLKLAEEGYTSRKADTDEAKSSWSSYAQRHGNPSCSLDATDAYSFDYQQNFPIPNLTHGQVFYQRQLSMYNFIVHDHVENTAIMYYYSEADAKRGGSEVSSLLQQVFSHTQTGARKCVLYSDGCNGQNRNRMVMSCMLNLTDNEHVFEQIDHKILLPGHTRMPNDTDGGLVEQRQKVELCLLPEQYGALIQNARVKNKFTAIYPEQSSFKDYDVYSKHVLKSSYVDQNGDKIKVSKMRWFSYGQSDVFNIETGVKETVHHPREIWMKSTLSQSEPWTKCHCVSRNTVGAEIKPKYKGKLPISKAKWDDLQKIAQLLPQECRSFYNNLMHEGSLPSIGDNDSDSDLDYD